MTPMLRCVFDTNVIVSSVLFTQSIPGQAVLLALRQHTVLVPQETLEELARVIRRKKFDAYVSREDREQFLTKFILTTELVTIHEHVTDCRDPKDNKFLDVAINGNATVLVSGDDDLLILHPFRTISIIAPQVFLNKYS